jgi:hypothetical protein
MSQHPVRKFWSGRLDKSKNYVIVKIDKQRRHWSFPVSNFSQASLETLLGTRAPCGGCLTLPTDGYHNTGKVNWCILSKEIAQYQEDQMCCPLDELESDDEIVAPPPSPAIESDAFEEIDDSSSEEVDDFWEDSYESDSDYVPSDYSSPDDE